MHAAGRCRTRSCLWPGRVRRSSGGWPATSGVRSSSESTSPRRSPEGIGRPYDRSTLGNMLIPTLRESTMNRRSLAFAACAVGVGGLTLARHVEAGGAKVTQLSRRDIVEKLDGKAASATVVEVTFEPGQKNSPHRHTGPVFGYVL